MLLTGSGDELCGPLPALFQAAAYHLALCQPFCLSSLCLLRVCMEISLLPLLPSLVCLHHPTPCVVCSFLVHCLLFSFFFFFFFAGWRVSLPRGLCWFIPRVAEGILHNALCSPVGLPNVSQAGLEPVSVSVGGLLFSQCNMA
jgi:hypothetical protein